jgi:hypothetical protein
MVEPLARWPFGIDFFLVASEFSTLDGCYMYCHEPCLSVTGARLSYQCFVPVPVLPTCSCLWDGDLAPLFGTGVIAVLGDVETAG